MPSAPTWRKLVESFAAGGRELPLGDRPKDWVDATEGVSPAVDREDWHGTEPAPSPATGNVVPDVAGDAPPADERYLIQFTASQEYTGLLERAQDLLSHAVPNRSLEEVHLRALRLLIDKLEKRKYGAPRAKPPAEPSTSEPTRRSRPRQTCSPMQQAYPLRHHLKCREAKTMHSFRASGTTSSRTRWAAARP